MSMRTDFYYNGKSHVYLTGRDGISYCVPTSTNIPVKDAGLTIHCQRDVSKTVKINISSEDMEFNINTQQTLDNYRESPAGDQYHRSSEVYKFSDDQIRNHGGSIYIPCVDMVVSLRNPHNDSSIQHPYSNASLIENNNLLQAIGLPSTEFRMFVIDNRDIFGKRWFRLGNYICPLASVRKLDMVDGLYVIHNNPDVEEGEREFIPMAELIENKAPITLFRDKAEARSYSENKASEVIISNLKMELERLKAEHSLSKLQREEELAIEKQNRERLQQQEDLLTKQAQQRLTTEQRDSDFVEATRKKLLAEIAEERAERRKVLIEILKMIPSIISIVAAGIAIYKKKS